MLNEHRELIDWLLIEGGPVIRYRTATELLEHKSGPRLVALANELLVSPQVVTWLDRLGPGELHHSKPSAFENVSGKLAELGVSAGMQPFDERITYFISLLDNWEEEPQAFSNFHQVLVAAGLARTDLAHLSHVRGTIAKRLQAIDMITSTADFDVYVPAEELAVLPAAYRDKQFIQPRFFTGNTLNLPSLHDMLAIAYCQVWLARMGYEARINNLVDYVLNPVYQRLDEGYGYMWTQDDGPRKYYAIGWSVHLPGFNGFELKQPMAGAFIMRLEMMAWFKTARRSQWFKRCLAHLETFRQASGRYRFPRPYLLESRSGYGVYGHYMGLEEVRRSAHAIELESTFRMLRLKQLIGFL